MKRPKNIFFWVLTAVLILIVATGVKELQLVAKSIREGVWYFLILAGAFQVLYFVFQSEVRRSLYSILEIKEKFWDMLKMTFSAMFVGTAIPSFHMAALGLFMQEAKSKNYSQSKALVAGITFLFFDTLGFFIALILALFLLFKMGDLNKFQVISSAILLGIVFGGMIGIKYVLKNEQRVLKFFKKISKILPKKQRKKWFPEKELELISKEAIEAKIYYLQKIYKLWKPTAFALLTQVAGAATLASCFLAYGMHFTVSEIVIVYAMAVLFQIVAITPYGLGSAEFLLTVVLSNFGMPVSQALLLTLTFRFFSFWIPMLTGYISLRTFSFGEEAKQA